MRHILSSNRCRFNVFVEIFFFQHAEAAKFCDEMMQRVMGKIKSIDTDTENMQNVTEEVLDHLRVNVRDLYLISIFHFF